MNIKCPVCGDSLIYHRIEDSEFKAYVEDDEVTEIEDRSNGSSRVYCSSDDSHEIPDELWTEVIQRAEDYRY